MATLTLNLLWPHILLTYYGPTYYDPTYYGSCYRASLRAALDFGLAGSDGSGGSGGSSAGLVIATPLLGSGARG